MEQYAWLWLAGAGWSLFCYRLGLTDRLRPGKSRQAGAIRRTLERVEGYKGPGKGGTA